MKKVTIYGGGDIQDHFQRLGINPECTYSAMSKYGTFSGVWEMNVNDWVILKADADRENTYIKDKEGAMHLPESLWQDAWWRQNDHGISFDCETPVVVNGVEVIGFENRSEDDLDEDDEDYVPPQTTYSTLLDHFCDSIGVSTERNVIAAAVTMADANGWSVGELFTKLQPTFES